MMNENTLSQFELNRPHLLAVAYRMLGSATDAEDIVQEAYLRYQTVPYEEIVTPKAFLTTIVTRLCLNQLSAARTQRENYIGPWLPEPVLTQAGDVFMPDQKVELHESLSLAFLALLEQLSPLERAVFLLRQVFDYEYAEIAQILERDEAACRQVLSRAKKHIAERRPRYKATPQAHQEIFARFIQAVEEGQLTGLIELLADDVTLWADSGGKVYGAIYKPLQGREAVAKFVLTSPRRVMGPYQTEVTEVNGEAALVLRTGEEIRLIVTISSDGEKVTAIRVIGNPDKLKWINRLVNN